MLHSHYQRSLSGRVVAVDFCAAFDGIADSSLVPAFDGILQIVPRFFHHVLLRGCRG